MDVAQAAEDAPPVRAALPHVMSKLLTLGDVLLNYRRYRIDLILIQVQLRIRGSIPCFTSSRASRARSLTSVSLIGIYTQREIFLFTGVPVPQTPVTGAIGVYQHIETPCVIELVRSWSRLGAANLDVRERLCTPLICTPLLYPSGLWAVNRCHRTAEDIICGKKRIFRV